LDVHGLSSVFLAAESNQILKNYPTMNSRHLYIHPLDRK